MSHFSVLVVILLFVTQKGSFGGKTEHFRQKRCIVVQKQSGTHGDSSEGDGGEGEERLPRPRPADVEDFSEKPLKYRLPEKSRRTKSKNYNSIGSTRQKIMQSYDELFKAMPFL